MANDMTIFTSAEAEKLAGVSQSGLSKVEQMACYIAQYYTQKITVQQVADLVGLKPNYAMSLFQKAFGATLINHLTKHRLSHAQRMLCTTEDSNVWLLSSQLQKASLPHLISPKPIRVVRIHCRWVRLLSVNGKFCDRLDQ